MIRLKKFVALVLTIWFPLFSGNAMAASVAMQSMGAMGGECETGVAKNVEHHISPHQASMASAEKLEPAPEKFGQSFHQQNQLDQQKSSCKHCGVCHLACTGYMATAAIKVPADQPLAQSFAPFSSHFQSTTTTPQVPPPLVRV